MKLPVIVNLLTGSTVQVDATVFIKGLYRHRTVGDEFRQSLSHKSGLTLLSGLPNDSRFLLTEVLPVFRKFDWDVPPEAIVANQEMMEAVSDMAVKYARAIAEERRVIADLGGQITPGSGARPHSKRDGNVVSRNLKIKIDVKATELTEFSIPLADFEFIRKQSYEKGQIPAYVISFLGAVRACIAVGKENDFEDLPEPTLPLHSTGTSVMFPAVTARCLKPGSTLYFDTPNGFRWIVMPYVDLSNIVHHG